MSNPNFPDARYHVSSLRTDGSSKRITLMGDFQADWRNLITRLFEIRGIPTRRDWCLVTYTGLLTTLLGTFVLLLFYDKRSAGPVWPILAFALAAIIAERQSVRLSPRAEISVSVLPIVLAAVIYGPLAGICVSVASLLPSFEAPYGRWLTWTCTRSLAAGAAGVASRLFGVPTGHTFGRVLAAAAVATVVGQMGDFLLGSVAVTLRRMPLREIRRVGSMLLLALPLYVPMTGLLVYAYGVVSPWSVVLFLFPALVAQKLFLLYQEQRATAEQLALAIHRQDRAHMSFASALVATLDARDQYTAGHSQAVAAYAYDIAGQLGLSEEEQRLVHLAGLVHDIGKIGLPPGLLDKRGSLTLGERRQMETHPVIGERILAKVDDYAPIAEIVRHHHERVDGNGYPDRLIADDIPLLSRIIAVADAYNAMTSDRPYREAMPTSVARLRMAQAVESQFDTRVVAAFEAVLAGADEEYRSGKTFGPVITGKPAEFGRSLAATA